jgi:hypothetical protein
LALLLSDGVATLNTEFAKVSKTSYKVGDESKNVYVVLFSIEGWNGGNGARQYLAVFQENSKEGRSEEWKFNELSLVSFVKVGEDYGRIFKSIFVAGDLITLDGFSWNNDAHCCPSKPAKAVFRFDRNSIVEDVVANHALKQDAPTVRPLVPR